MRASRGPAAASSRKSPTRSPISADRRARKRRSRRPSHTPEPFEPVAREAPPAAAAVEPRCSAARCQPAEPPKRRSTVREPAPMFSSGAMSDVQPSPLRKPADRRLPPEPVAVPERRPRRRRTQSPAASAGGRSADKMKSAWADRDAEAAVARYADVPRDVALRVYTTRLLGADPKLVLHGGGNTSVKTRVADLNGDAIDVLCVKGSGWDMATIEPPGLPAVRLDAAEEAAHARRAVGRRHGAPAAREPDRSGGAQPVGRDAAARLPAAQVRRPHPFDRGARASPTSRTATRCARRSTASAWASCPTSCRASRWRKPRRKSSSATRRSKA